MRGKRAGGPLGRLGYRAANIAAPCARRRGAVAEPRRRRRGLATHVEDRRLIGFARPPDAPAAVHRHRAVRRGATAASPRWRRVHARPRRRAPWLIVVAMMRPLPGDKVGDSYGMVLEADALARPARRPSWQLVVAGDDRSRGAATRCWRRSTRRPGRGWAQAAALGTVAARPTPAGAAGRRRPLRPSPPAVRELFGMALVEVPRCPGRRCCALRPVVAGDAGGVPAIVRDGETGLSDLAPAATPRRWTTRRRALLDDRRAARRWAAQAARPGAVASRAGHRPGGRRRWTRRSRGSDDGPVPRPAPAGHRPPDARGAGGAGAGRAGRGRAGVRRLGRSTASGHAGPGAARCSGCRRCAPATPRSRRWSRRRQKPVDDAFRRHSRRDALLALFDAAWHRPGSSSPRCSRSAGASAASSCCRCWTRPDGRCRVVGVVWCATCCGAAGARGGDRGTGAGPVLRPCPGAWRPNAGAPGGHVPAAARSPTRCATPATSRRRRRRRRARAKRWSSPPAAARSARRCWRRRRRRGPGADSARPALAPTGRRRQRAARRRRTASSSRRRGATSARCWPEPSPCPSARPATIP